MTAPVIPANALSVSTQHAVANSVVDDMLAGRPDADAPNFQDPESNVSLGSSESFSEGEQPRGADGKFVRNIDTKASITPPTEGQPAPAQTEVASPPSAADQASNDAKSEAPKDPIKLATDFSIVGPDGAELDTSDVVTKVGLTRFKVGEKDYEMPYDRVVRLAKSGIHNEALYKDAQDAKDMRSDLESQIETSRQTLGRHNEVTSAIWDDLIRQGILEQLAPNSPSAQYLSRWQHFNSPESQVERLRRENEELRQQKAGQSAADKSASFVQDDVLTPIGALLQQYPSVTQEEIIGRFTVLTQKFGAVIQPKDFAAVRTIIRETLPAYAASVHESRTGQATALRKAQETSTLLKKRVAQNARPIGRAATAEEAKAKRPEPRNVDELKRRVIDDVLAEVS